MSAKYQQLMHVHMRPITASNISECLQLRVKEDQINFVATTAKSLAEASVNPTLFPLAIYDVAALGYEQPTIPMIGFAMYEVSAGVGFIVRLLIDQRYQRRGYGKAAMLESIRRLRLYPEVELIATSYKRENIAAGQLYASLGFVPWQIEWAQAQADEMFVMLPP